MNKFIQIQLKLNSFGFLKLTLITLAMLLSFGAYTRANAESATEMEVLSVPAQEAFFIEDKTQGTFNDDSKLQNKKTPGNSNLSVPDTWENTQESENIANFVPGSLDNSSDRRIWHSRKLETTFPTKTDYPKSDYDRQTHSLALSQF
ncbi:hypothetical protein NUACC21_40420 [Scytonema sp. NUACC21]